MKLPGAEKYLLERSNAALQVLYSCWRTVPEALEDVRAGKMVAIGLAADKRVAALLDKIARFGSSALQGTALDSCDLFSPLVGQRRRAAKERFSRSGYLTVVGQNPPLTVTFRFSDYRSFASACPDAVTLPGAAAASLPGGLISIPRTVLQRLGPFIAKAVTRHE